MDKYREGESREQVPGVSEPVLSPAERAKGWRETAERLPHTPPLSDEAISRESLYGDVDWRSVLRT